MQKKPPTRTPSVPPTHDSLNAPAARVLRRFRVVFNAVKTHFRQVEATAGVAGAQVWALSVIHHEPGIGVGGVARAMDIHQSTASNLLKPLIERGMVAADRDGLDRRAVHLHICAKGVAVLHRAPGPFAGVLPEALDSMDAATLGRLDRDLAKLCHALGVHGRGGTVPLGQSDSSPEKAPGSMRTAARTKPKAPTARGQPKASFAPPTKAVSQTRRRA